MKDKYDFLLIFSTPQNHRCKKALGSSKSALDWKRKEEKSISYSKGYNHVISIGSVSHARSAIKYRHN